jgi:hypothetical protein
MCRFETHIPEIRHEPAVTVGTQALFISSQASLVHESESSQVRVVPVHELAPLHVSISVQYNVSSQVAPMALGDHAVVEVPGVHAWHWFAGLVTPVAAHVPLIRQFPPASG